MTAHERAARLFMPGLPRDGFAPAFARLLAETPPAGLLVFRRDGGDSDGLRRRIAELRSAAARPLLFGIDEEGGFVSQLAPDVPVPPSARVLGRAADEEMCARLGAETGRALAALGIDIDFAPCFDVDSEPTNPVIGPRALAADPERVARLALAFARGLEHGGVLWCAKHFPGHGGTGVDSHLALPFDRSARAQLEAVHLPPFRAAIAAGTPIVMVAHVAYPELDASGDPASVSAPIASALLRERLGFVGLTITDAMEMRGLADRLPSGEAAVRALEAGCDLLLYGAFDAGVEEALDAVARAIASGRLGDERVRASEARIERLFARAAVRRAAVESGGATEPPLSENDRLELCRRALRSLAPALWTGSPPPDAGPGLVIEPAWPHGPSLAELLARGSGLDVRTATWEEESDLAGAAWVVLAHARRTAPSAGERARIDAAPDGRTVLVAFGQDAFLAEYPAHHRLSAGDPGETMRRAVAEAVLVRLGLAPVAGQPRGAAAR